jgi:octopine/nopaline transport system substrate-binding protein
MKILAALLAFACLAPIVAQAEGPKEWKEIRVATEGAFRPWNYSNPDGTLGGFEVELYADLCRRMQAHCTLEATPFDGVIPALLAGKFDAIMAAMSATPKREQVIAFSVPYATTGGTFATVKGSDLASLGMTDQIFSLTTDEAGAQKAIDKLAVALKGKVIGVQTATIYVAFLEKYLKGKVEWREYKTTEQHDLDLEAGRVDIIMGSTATLRATIEKSANQDLVLTGPRFQGGLLGRGSSVGLRKEDTELKAKFDKAIGEAQADGTIARLATQYFGFDASIH